MIRGLSLVLTVALVASCGPPPPRYQYARGGGGGGAGGQGGKPSWVDGNPGRYPGMSYLTAVGRGGARGACEDAARGALAKVFNSRVSQVSQDWQGHFSKVTEAAPSVRVEAMNISQLTRVSTDKVLKGARIAEHWIDRQGSHHCLGVIDRAVTARRLKEEIARLDKKMGLQIQQAQALLNEHLLELDVDHVEVLDARGRDRVFNLGYFTWVEQQGTPFDLFVARHDQEFWNELRGYPELWDEMIREFNAATGLG